MMRLRHIKTAIVLLAALFAMITLGACAPQGGESADQQTQNRQYMTQVNQIMEDLQENLDGFNDAVARGDIVGMRTQADNAFQVVDKLEALEVPDDLKDIHKSYLDGVAGLKEALSGYVDLYTETQTETKEKSFDWDTYGDRLKEIQQLYDDSIKKLQDGDTKATEKN